MSRLLPRSLAQVHRACTQRPPRCRSVSYNSTSSSSSSTVMTKASLLFECVCLTHMLYDGSEDDILSASLVQRAVCNRAEPSPHPSHPRPHGNGSQSTRSVSLRRCDAYKECLDALTKLLHRVRDNSAATSITDRGKKNSNTSGSIHHSSGSSRYDSYTSHCDSTNSHSRLPSHTLRQCYRDMNTIVRNVSAKDHKVDHDDDHDDASEYANHILCSSVLWRMWECKEQYTAHQRCRNTQRDSSNTNDDTNRDRSRDRSDIKDIENALDVSERRAVWPAWAECRVILMLLHRLPRHQREGVLGAILLTHACRSLQRPLPSSNGAEDTTRTKPSLLRNAGEVRNTASRHARNVMTECASVWMVSSSLPWCAHRMGVSTVVLSSCCDHLASHDSQHTDDSIGISSNLPSVGKVREWLEAAASAVGCTPYHELCYPSHCLHGNEYNSHVNNYLHDKNSSGNKKGNCGMCGKDHVPELESMCAAPLLRESRDHVQQYMRVRCRVLSRHLTCFQAYWRVVIGDILLCALNQMHVHVKCTADHLEDNRFVASLASAAENRRKATCETCLHDVDARTDCCDAEVSVGALLALRRIVCSLGKHARLEPILQLHSFVTGECELCGSTLGQRVRRCRREALSGAWYLRAQGITCTNNTAHLKSMGTETSTHRSRHTTDVDTCDHATYAGEQKRHGNMTAGTRKDSACSRSMSVAHDLVARSATLLWREVVLFDAYTLLTLGHTAERAKVYREDAESIAVWLSSSANKTRVIQQSGNTSSTIVARDRSNDVDARHSNNENINERVDDDNSMDSDGATSVASGTEKCNEPVLYDTKRNDNSTSYSHLRTAQRRRRLRVHLCHLQEACLGHLQLLHSLSHLAPSPPHEHQRRQRHQHNRQEPSKHDIASDESDGSITNGYHAPHSSVWLSALHRQLTPRTRLRLDCQLRDALRLSGKALLQLGAAAELCQLYTRCPTLGGSWEAGAALLHCGEAAAALAMFDTFVKDTRHCVSVPKRVRQVMRAAVVAVAAQRGAAFATLPTSSECGKELENKERVGVEKGVLLHEMLDWAGKDGELQRWSSVRSVISDAVWLDAVVEGLLQTRTSTSATSATTAQLKSFSSSSSSSTGQSMLVASSSFEKTASHHTASTPARASFSPTTTTTNATRPSLLHATRIPSRALTKSSLLSLVTSASPCDGWTMACAVVHDWCRSGAAEKYGLLRATVHRLLTCHRTQLRSAPHARTTSATAASLTKRRVADSPVHRPEYKYVGTRCRRSYRAVESVFRDSNKLSKLSPTPNQLRRRLLAILWTGFETLPHLALPALALNTLLHDANGGKKTTAAEAATGVLYLLRRATPQCVFATRSLCSPATQRRVGALLCALQREWIASKRAKCACGAPRKTQAWWARVWWRVWLRETRMTGIQAHPCTHPCTSGYSSGESSSTSKSYSSVHSSNDDMGNCTVSAVTRGSKAPVKHSNDNNSNTSPPVMREGVWLCVECHQFNSGASGGSCATCGTPSRHMSARRLCLPAQQLVECAHCHTDNILTRRHCARCGASLARASAAVARDMLRARQLKRRMCRTACCRRGRRTSLSSHSAQDVQAARKKRARRREPKCAPVRSDVAALMQGVSRALHSLNQRAFFSAKCATTYCYTKCVARARRGVRRLCRTAPDELPWVSSASVHATRSTRVDAHSGSSCSSHRGGNCTEKNEDDLLHDRTAEVRMVLERLVRVAEGVRYKVGSSVQPSSVALSSSSISSAAAVASLQSSKIVADDKTEECNRTAMSRYYRSAVWRCRRPWLQSAVDLVHLLNTTTVYDTIGFETLSRLCMLIRPAQSAHIAHETRWVYLRDMRLSRGNVVNGVVCPHCLRRCFGKTTKR